ncbi:hypothetical protein BH24ACI3_BH24ACI3_06490 [soil metagenome]
MNTIETIQEKIIHLPLSAQREVLGAVERIEARYRSLPSKDENGNGSEHILDLLSQIQIDGPTDLAENHDLYAHGKLEK